MAVSYAHLFTAPRSVEEFLPAEARTAAMVFTRPLVANPAPPFVVTQQWCEPCHDHKPFVHHSAHSAHRWQNTALGWACPQCIEAIDRVAWPQNPINPFARRVAEVAPAIFAPATFRSRTDQVWVDAWGAIVASKRLVAKRFFEYEFTKKCIRLAYMQRSRVTAASSSRKRKRVS